MNLFDIYYHERLWLLERERVDRSSRLRVALQLTQSRRGFRAEIASALRLLARRVEAQPEVATPAGASCPWAPKRVP